MFSVKKQTKTCLYVNETPCYLFKSHFCKTYVTQTSRHYNCYFLLHIRRGIK